MMCRTIRQVCAQPASSTYSLRCCDRGAIIDHESGLRWPTDKLHANMLTPARS